MLLTLWLNLRSVVPLWEFYRLRPGVYLVFIRSSMIKFFVEGASVPLGWSAIDTGCIMVGVKT